MAAFRETLFTHYEERRLRESRRWERREPPPALQAARALSGTRLIRALEGAGVRVRASQARSGLQGLWPLVERLLHTRTRLAFARLEPPPQGASALDPNAFPGSFLVADGVKRRLAHEVEAGGLRAEVHVVAFSRRLIDPYPVWQTERNGTVGGPALWRTGDTLYLDRGRLEARADALLFDREADLRQAPARATEDRLTPLPRRRRLRAVKDALRWRSFAPAWPSLQALPPDAGRRAFAARRADELIEAAALLGAAQAAATGPTPPNPAAIGTRALLASLDGAHPLGALATICGLAARADAAGEAALVRLAAEGLPSRTPRDLARLARVQADRLRRAGRAAATRSRSPR